MNDTILVVGATGRVGREVVSSLLSRGARVRVMSRSPRKIKDVEVVVGSLDHDADVVRALSGVGAAFYPALHDVNDIAQAQRFVAAARTAKLRRLVAMTAFHTTSSNAFGRWFNTKLVNLLMPHYASKWQVERILVESGLDPVVLLPTNFFQNDDVHAKEIVGGSYPVPLGVHGLNRVDTRDVGDAAARALLDADVTSGWYPVVGPEVLGGPQSAAVWQEVLGRPVTYAGDDVEVWRANIGDRVTDKERTDWAKTFVAIQRIGKYFKSAIRAASPRSRFIVGHAPRTYREYVRDRVQQWTERRAA
jgi:uncharacterized protein YbjT (DUF2867 family)